MSLGRIRPQFTQGLEKSVIEDKKAFASAVTPRFTLESDVALTAQVIAQLDEAKAKIEYFHKIYVEWGFSSVDPLGNGIVLNFLDHQEPVKHSRLRRWRDRCSTPL